MPEGSGRMKVPHSRKIWWLCRDGYRDVVFHSLRHGGALPGGRSGEGGL